MCEVGLGDLFWGAMAVVVGGGVGLLIVAAGVFWLMVAMAGEGR